MYGSYYIALSCSSLILGFLLFIFVRLTQYRLSENMASGLIIIGLLLEGLAAVTGLIPAIFRYSTFLALTSASIAILLLVASLITYIRFQLTPMPEPPQIDEGAHCDSVLEVPADGKPLVLKKVQGTWRTKLTSKFTCTPSDGELVEQAWASGYVYTPPIFFDRDKIQVDPKITIECPRCLAVVSETGDKEDVSGVVRVAVNNQVFTAGNTARVLVTMAAALNAPAGVTATVTGGWSTTKPTPPITPSAPPGSVTITGSVSVQMKYNEASLQRYTAMGTYQWRCIAPEPPYGAKKIQHE